jgi:Mg2+/Co2+ transporter CorB
MTPAQTRQTSLTSAVSFLVGTLLLQLGIEPTAAVTASIAALVICAVSYVSPRELGISRPGGLTAAAATVLVFVLELLGHNLDAEAALAIVTLPATVIAGLTPRQESIVGELEERPHP